MTRRCGWGGSTRSALPRRTRGRSIYGSTRRWLVLFDVDITAAEMGDALIRCLPSEARLVEALRASGTTALVFQDQPRASP